MRALLILLAASSVVLAANPPRPLPHHPGNVFVEGEDVVLPAPADSYEWFNYEGKKVARRGKLPVGYYEARSKDGKRISFAVIAPMKVDTPASSPIGIDVAMAWFYKTEKEQRAAANLCRIAGINWVRDRLNWGEMEPQRGTFAPHNIYDDTASIQTEAGLRVLQVDHIAPPWANPDPKRFPIDLRDAYRFYREMAKRWKGQVLAIEPWNEADIDVFGGHTGSEMASMQKAAYLGLKAGNPEVIACQNVFAIARQSTLDDFAANEASPYFDTHNLHHYVNFDKYPQVYAAHRAISAGKPMWVTECNLPVQWADEKTKEPSEEHLRWQANRVAKVFATSLNEGSANVFYFMLPHYVERQTQYGILRPDLTPRPAYVALAAVGRFLCDAKPLGTFDADDGVSKGYLFNALVDGEKKCVMVAWRNEAKEIPFEPPVECVFDHLGREKKNVKKGTLPLSGAPLFVVMKAGAANVQEQPLPKLDMASATTRNPVVLQALLPVESVVLEESAYALSPKERHELKLFAYNFTDEPMNATVKVDAPAGWDAQAAATVKIEPHGRSELPLTIAARPVATNATVVRVICEGAVLSLRILDEKPAPGR